MPFDFSTRRYISPTEGGGSDPKLTTATIPPSVVSQVVLPPEGYDGYSQVTVPGVDYTVDPNITAINIVNGVNILGITGIASTVVSKEVARYKIDDNGIASINDQDITETFKDIKDIKPNTFEVAFYNSHITGNVCFNNCIYINGMYSFTNAFARTNISNLYFPNTKHAGHFTFSFIASNCMNIENVDFHSLRSTGTQAFASSFRNSNVNYADFSNFTGGDALVFSGAFRNATINYVNFDGLTNARDGLMSSCFYSSKGLTNIVFPNLTQTSNNAFNSCFYNSELVSFEAYNINKIGDYSFANSFSNAVNFTYFNIPECVTISGNSTFYYAFRGSNISSFKLSPTSDLEYNSCFLGSFFGCKNLTNVNLATPTIYNIGASFFTNFCRECPNLVSVDLSSVSSAYASLSDQGFANAFRNDVNLTTVNVLSLSLPSIGTNAFRNTFYGCTNLTTMDWAGIETFCMGNMCFDNAYAFSGIQNLSFSGLWANLWSWSSNTSRPLKNMLANVDGCTVHFPASAKDMFQNHVDFQIGFGGTNTTVLFDLPNVKEILAVDGFYNITENGEMGGSTTAVNTSSNNANAWKGFVLNISNGWKPTVGDDGPYYYTIYEPKGIKALNIRLQTAYTLDVMINTPVIINTQVSNDGQNWEEASATYDRIVIEGSTSSAKVTFNKPDYFKYYKIYFNSYENNSNYLPIVNFIDINGTYKYI